MSEIRLQVTYPVDAAVLWEAIADPTRFSRWCMTEKGFELKKGASFNLESQPNRFWDGIFVCEVKDFEEGSRLSYTYKNDGLGLTGIVDWTVTKEKDGSSLRLIQTGFEGLKGSFFKMLLGAGWKQMLRKNLKKELLDSQSKPTA